MIQQVLAYIGAVPQDGCILSLATQVAGLIPMDMSDQPLHSAVIWMNHRFVARCEALRHRLEQEQVFELTGLNLDASHVSPKIHWWMEHHPEIYTRTAQFSCRVDI